MQDEDQVPASRKRNQSDIVLKWGDQKRLKLDTFLIVIGKRDHLIEEVATLREEKIF
jgi:hypothetical protein